MKKVISEAKCEEKWRIEEEMKAGLNIISEAQSTRNEK
jgi:hypothetical protein